MISASIGLTFVAGLFTGTMLAGAALYFLISDQRRSWLQLRQRARREHKRAWQAERRASDAEHEFYRTSGELDRTRNELTAAHSAWGLLLCVHCAFLELFDQLRKEALRESMSNIENKELLEQSHKEAFALSDIARESLRRLAVLRNRLARKEAIEALEKIVRALVRLSKGP